MMALPTPDPDDPFKYFLSPEKLDADLEKLSRTELSQLICYFMSQGYQAFQTLQNHLMKERPPPNAPDGSDHPIAHEDRGVSTHKIDVMDILALKVAAQMAFDLQFLQDSLPIVLQDRLLRKFLQLATGITKFDPFHDVGWPAWTPIGRFAHMLFHRWSLKSAVDNEFASYRIQRPEPVNVVLPKGLTDIPPKVFEKGNSAVNLYIRSNRQLYVERLDPYLHRSSWEVAMPKAKCFVYPKWDTTPDESVDQQWNLAEPMTLQEFQALVAYDIGRFLFQDRRFDRALALFLTVDKFQSCLSRISRTYIQPSRVEAYIIACNSFKSVRKNLPNARKQLHDIVDQLANEERSRKSHMRLSDELVRNTTQALLGDTLSRRNELCRIERDDFEANLLPNWEVLYFAVVTCNLLHRVMAGQAMLSLYAEKLQAQGDAGVAYLLSCLTRCLGEARENERMNLKCFMWYLLQALPDDLDFAGSLLSTEGCICHFDLDEQAAVRAQADGRALAVGDDAFMELEELERHPNDASDPWFAEEELEEDEEPVAGPSGATAVDATRLVTSYDPEEIRILLDRLLAAPGQQRYSCEDLTRLSERWRVRPAGLDRLLADCAKRSVAFANLYVLVAKAQLLQGLGEWDGAHLLLLSAERLCGEADSSDYCVLQAVRQEAALLRAHSFLARGVLLGGSEQELVQACKAACTSLRLGTDPPASEELLVAAVCCLLSTGHGTYLVDVLGSATAQCPGRGALWLGAILARVAAEPEDGMRASCRELWDFLSRCLPIVPGGQAPNGSGPGARRGMVQAGPPLSRQAFHLFLRLLRERRHLSLLLSALIAMCKAQLADLNILIYAGSKALLEFWPSGGCINVNQDSLQEALNLLLDAALAKFPNECPWLLMRAELAFSQRHYKRALIAYLECGAAASEFFSQTVPDDLYSKQTLQRMLRCCEEMRFYGQAAVLCQLATTEQGETDYKSAVRFLKMQDESLDNIESYLPYIWDVTLLEVAASIFGQRYGAVEKRARIIATISRPELNMANKADVKHNVEAQRRLAWLRLMCDLHFL